MHAACGMLLLWILNDTYKHTIRIIVGVIAGFGPSNEEGFAK